MTFGILWVGAETATGSWLVSSKASLSTDSNESLLWPERSMTAAPRVRSPGVHHGYLVLRRGCADTQHEVARRPEQALSSGRPFDGPFVPDHALVEV